MNPLSSTLTDLPAAVEVVVVGSGYGGAIAACRLARAGRQVVLLERGKEFLPGEFPADAVQAASEFQVAAPLAGGVHVGSDTGLFDLRLGKEMDVLVGCGLGGTSLINANVSLRPDDRVFEDARWPRVLRDDRSGLEKGYAAAWKMLRPTPYPSGTPAYPPLAKVQRLSEAASALRATATLPPINVNFEPDRNVVGVTQGACVGCGDCTSGCNHAAKNTTQLTYLPDAVRHGARIFTRVAVHHLSRRGDRWIVHYALKDAGREAFGDELLELTAEVVVLGAGTLGSTEILLRSREAGLALSPRLGERFSGNGDVIAFAFDGERVADGVGTGPGVDPAAVPAPGPCITGLVDRRRPDRPLEEGYVIEDAAIPGPLTGRVMAAVYDACALLAGEETAPEAFEAQLARGLESLVEGAQAGALEHTETFLVMSQDDGAGRLALVGDRAHVDWPGCDGQPNYSRVAADLKTATGPLKGIYLPNPATAGARNLITVHPLGGCVMGDDATTGVVDDRGRVFAGASGSEVLPGLLVADGSVIPRPLGVNPLWTISAVAERSMALLAQERGWVIDEVPPSPDPLPLEVAPARRGLRFTERMKGWASQAPADLGELAGRFPDPATFQHAEERGRTRDLDLSFTVTVLGDDLDAMLTDPDHRARILGTVDAPWLSAAPLTVADGRFQLFSVDPDRVETRHMTYDLALVAEDGSTYHLFGFKTLADGEPWQAWPATTTLYTTVRRYDPAGPIVARGILRIAPEDFARQATTMRCPGAKDLADEADGLARFGAFFGGVVIEHDARLLVRPTVFHRDAPPRTPRPLRLPPPLVTDFRTPDGTALRLTRYRPAGQAKGPVLLGHGLGVSSGIFTVDTIATNLAEALVAAGHDTWLLDFRASIRLPASHGQFDADAIATQDWPSAVQAVLAATGARSLQIVAHCFGATTATMALLRGMPGVRAAVLSQVSAHPIPPLPGQLKAGLHAPQLFEALGLTSLTAYTDDHAGLFDRLFDEGLHLVTPGCNSATCHRVTFLYGQLYEHGQLNEATHATLHERFGMANLRALDHLALMVRKGQVAAYSDRFDYLSRENLKGMALPIRFISGERNQCFRPESTQKTMELLAHANGAELYDRVLVPGYGHIDCIFGKDAARDVYPYIVEHLERT